MNLSREDLQWLAEDPNSFLKQGAEAFKTIEAIRARIDYWREFAASITAPPKNNDAPNSSRNIVSRVEKSVLEIIELEEESAEEFVRALEANKTAKRLFNNWLTDSRHKQLFEYYYIDGLTLDKVARKMSYPLRWVGRLKAQALEIIKEKATALLQ